MYNRRNQKAQLLKKQGPLIRRGVRMSYLVVGFDLIAGLLVGIHLWVPGKYRQIWDKWLLEYLAPTSDPVDEKTVKGSILTTTLVVIVVMVVGYFIDINQGSFTSQELLNSSLLVITGIPIAVVLLIIVIALYQKITIVHTIPLVIVITALGIAGPFTLLLINISNQTVDRIIIGFVFSLALMILLVQLLPLSRKFFTFESGVLPRLGVTIFVLSRIIQIANL